MEKLTLRRQDAERALVTLEDILGMSYSVIVRDAALQRFEYTFEALWKYAKEYLQEREGIIAASPKSTFRELLSVGIINDEQTAACLEMTDARNDIAHTYKEAVAHAIFAQLPRHASLIKKILAATA
jgi:nucleotidyltransferase substrate binding protein (TIGR01987 family)